MNLLEFSLGGSLVTCLGISLGKHKDDVSLTHMDVTDAAVELTEVRGGDTVRVVLVETYAARQTIAEREVVQYLDSVAAGSCDNHRHVTALVLRVELPVVNLRIRADLRIGLRRHCRTGAVGSPAEVIGDTGETCSFLHRHLVDGLRSLVLLVHLLEVVLERVVIYASLRVGTRVDGGQRGLARLLHSLLEVRKGGLVEFLPVSATAILSVLLRIRSPYLELENLPVASDIEVCAEIRAAGLVAGLHKAHTPDESVHEVACHLV